MNNEENTERGGTVIGEGKYKILQINHICMSCPNNSVCSLTPPCKALLEYMNIVERLDRNKKQKSIAGMKKGLLSDYCETDKELADLGNKIIKKFDELEFILDNEIKVAYVRSYEIKKTNKIVYGKCELVSKTMQAFLPYDYVVTIYDHNFAMLDENQQKIVMLHELRHIEIGDRGLKVREHDVEDFRIGLEEFGIGWADFDIGLEINILSKDYDPNGGEEDE